jgi:hypothetical protein
MNLQILRKKKQDEEDDNEFPPGFGVGGSTEDNEDEEGIDDTSADDEAENRPSRPQLSSRFTEAYKAASQVQPGPASENYTNYLNKGIPKKEDFPVSKIDRMSAILGGASEGYQKGAKSGIRTAKEVLDEPYDKGVARYNMQGKNLATAAALEDKELGRKASFAKSAAADIHNQAMEEAHNADTAARTQHWTALDKRADKNAQSKGWTKAITQDGHLIYTRPNVDTGAVETLDGGKIGESIPEKSKRILAEKAVEQSQIGAREKDVQDNASVNSRINTNIAAGQKLKEGEIAGERKASEPAQQNAEAQLRMKKIHAANGEVVKKYFNFDNNGTPISLKPGDPEDPDYQSVYQYVYGKKK